MHTAEVVNKGTLQWVRLPREITIETGEIAVLRLGDSLLLTPAPPARTPAGPPPPSASPSPPPPAAAVAVRQDVPRLEDDLLDALDQARRRLRAERMAAAARAAREDRESLSVHAVA